MYDRQGRYWQIANLRILVAWNGIKMRCSNTVFYVYSRKLSWNRGQKGTALVLNNFLEKTYKTVLQNFVFIAFQATKNLGYKCYGKNT
jgi:hypothetical protein